MESYRLAELTHAIFSATGRKTKKLRRSELFLSTVFKHGLLEGSTIVLQYRKIVDPFRGTSFSSIEQNFSKFSGKILY